MLNVNNVNFSYGEAQVLRDVSLEVKSGTITALMGSNGAGKTTLMNVISGLLNPSSGSITFNNHEIAGFKPYKVCEHGLSHVPEGRKIFPRMTIRENLELGAIKVSRQQKNSLLEKIFTMYPILEKRQTQKAGTLSGGEQQQLAIGRGLMGRPKLLLLDEPTLGLSPLLANGVLETVQSLVGEGITILLVSQEVVGALEIADYGYVLDNGKMYTHGTREELLNNDEIRNVYLGIS
ncbi:ABC transporter ATP-binding protein [Sporosarcina sp. FSL W8-0480]|uniref:ABC transporter ATP-binding protein n=1 Tax=Sporosarcina sp. FSL W8-0480 TaxID=2954701 RepID=UPI0030D8D049